MRMQLNARVLSTLLAGDDTDPARIVHHSVEAGDDALVIQYAPAAARRANRAGAHAQEVALYRQVLARSHLLSDDQRAEALQATAIALFTTDRLRPALAAGQEAVAIRERLGEPAALGEALIALAPIQWVMAQSQASVSTAERAVRLLEPEAGGPRHTFALIYYGLLLTAVDRCDAAQPVAADAVAAAQGLGSAELEALALVLQGWARLRRRDDAGLAEMTDGVHRAVVVQQHLYGMIGYVLIVQELWRLGRFDDVERFVAAGSAYAHERDLDYYRDHLVAHRLRLQALRGEWNTAEAGLRGLGDDRVDPEVGGAPHWLPSLARLLVRRGADDADDVLDQAWDYARRADGLLELVPAALALLQRAWLTGEPAPVDARRLVLSRTNEVGRERLRGEMLRWLHRLAEPAAPFDGCPEEFAAGLRGDWRAAASAWQEIGDPYEQALELLDSGEVQPTLEALTILDGLGATPAARLARQRLRELGLRQVPRGPQPVTRANPAGLTARQVEILRLLAQGLTNQEIAARLVVSVRTVDHHVSAVLQKLGVSGRREAAAAADRWGIGGGAGDAL
jgi:DNA-binding CsgD family transcriptional regulator